MWLHDVLTLPSTFGWPDLSALQGGLVYLDDSIVGDLEDALAQRRVALLAAPEGRGKSVFTKAYAYRKLQAGWVVWYVDLAKRGTFDVEETCHRIATLDALFIIENVQADTGAFERITNAFVASRYARLLLTERRMPEEEGFAEPALAGVGIAQPKVILLAPGFTTFRGIVSLHIENSIPKPLKPSANDLHQLIKKTGTNLRVLRAFLDAWEGGALVDVSEAGVLSKIYASRFGGLSHAAKLALVEVSAVTSYGIDTKAAAFGGEIHNLGGLVGLTTKGLSVFVSIAHRTDGYLNMKAFANRHGEDWQKLASAAVAKYLRGADTESVDRLLLQMRRVSPHRYREAVREYPELATRTTAAYIEKIGEASLGYARMCIRQYLPDDKSRLAFAEALFRQSNVALVSKYAAASLRDVEAIRSISRSSPRLSRRRIAIERQLTHGQWAEIWKRSPLSTLVRFLWRYGREPEMHVHTEQARLVLAQVASQPEFEERLNGVSLESAGKLVLLAGRLGEPVNAIVATAVTKHLKILPTARLLDAIFVAYNLQDAGHGAECDVVLLRVMKVFDASQIASEPRQEAITFLAGIAERSSSGAVRQHMRDVLVALVEFATRDLSLWDSKSLGRLLWSYVMFAPADGTKWLRAGGLEQLDRLGPSGDAWSMWLILWNVWQLDHEACNQLALAYRDAIEFECTQHTSATLPLSGLVHLQGLGHDLRAATTLDGLDESLQIVNAAAMLCILIAANALGDEALQRTVEAIRERLRVEGVVPSDVPAMNANPAVQDLVREVFRECGLIQSGDNLPALPA